MGNQPSKLALTSPGEAERLRERLLPFEQAYAASRQGQALSDATRLMLLALLRDAGETCVTDLCLIVEGEQAGVSRHLRILWEQGLVERQRYYRTVLYKLSENGERLLTALLDE
jgi:ArsR family transcriptional regulator